MPSANLPVGMGLSTILLAVQATATLKKLAGGRT